MAVPKNLTQKAATSVATVEITLRRRVVYIILIIGTALLFSVSLFVNYLSSNPALSKGLFIHSVSEVSNAHPLNITPAGWAFSIWGVIYLLQLAWIIYGLGLICRTVDEGPAYLNPLVLSPAFLIFFSLSTVFNVGWLFLWDREMFMASSVFLFCINMSTGLTFLILSSRLTMYRNAMIDQGRSLEVKFLTVAGMNGLGMYFTWTTIAALINFGVFLFYRMNTNLLMEEVCIICLSILAVFVVVYVSFDFTSMEMYTRYTFSPYMTVIWALSAILNKNYSSGSKSSIISAVLLGAVSLIFVMKIGVFVFKSRGLQFQYRQMQMGRRPIHEKQ